MGVRSLDKRPLRIYRPSSVCCFQFSPKRAGLAALRGERRYVLTHDGRRVPVPDLSLPALASSQRTASCQIGQWLDYKMSAKFSPPISVKHIFEFAYASMVNMKFKTVTSVCQYSIKACDYEGIMDWESRHILTKRISEHARQLGLDVKKEGAQAPFVRNKDWPNSFGQSLKPFVTVMLLTGVRGTVWQSLTPECVKVKENVLGIKIPRDKVGSGRIIQVSCVCQVTPVGCCPVHNPWTHCVPAKRETMVAIAQALTQQASIDATYTFRRTFMAGMAKSLGVCTESKCRILMEQSPQLMSRLRHQLGWSDSSESWIRYTNNSHELLVPVGFLAPQLHFLVTGVHAHMCDVSSFARMRDEAELAQGMAEWERLTAPVLEAPSISGSNGGPPLSVVGGTTSSSAVGPPDTRPPATPKRRGRPVGSKNKSAKSVSRDDAQVINVEDCSSGGVTTVKIEKSDNRFAPNLFDWLKGRRPDNRS